MDSLNTRKRKEILELLRSHPNSSRLRFVLIVHNRIGLSNKMLEENFNLRSIKRDELLRYPIKEVLIIIANAEEKSKYEKYGYFSILIKNNLATKK